MPVRIIIGGHLKEYTRQEGVVSVTGDTVGECVHNLIAVYPDIRERLFTKHGDLAALITLDGEVASQEKILGQPVSEGDAIYLLPTVGGG